MSGIVINWHGKESEKKVSGLLGLKLASPLPPLSFFFLPSIPNISIYSIMCKNSINKSVITHLMLPVE